MPATSPVTLQSGKKIVMARFIRNGRLADALRERGARQHCQHQGQDDLDHGPSSR